MRLVWSTTAIVLVCKTPSLLGHRQLVHCPGFLTSDPAMSCPPCQACDQADQLPACLPPPPRLLLRLNQPPTCLTSPPPPVTPQIDELQQAAAANNKSELEALLDAVRQEKNRVDERAARLQETVSRTQCEKATLDEQVATLQQENKVGGVGGGGVGRGLVVMRLGD